MLATLIETESLWRLAVFAFAGSLGFISFFGLAVVARDRAATRTEGAGWGVLGVIALIGCLAILAVGFWAMTQKS